MGIEPDDVCAFCDQHMSESDLADCITWTPYGRPYDMEPPDPSVAHRGCWLILSDERKAIYDRSCWHKPARFNMLTLEPIRTERRDET